MIKDYLFFKTNEEMFAYFKGPRQFEELKPIEEVKDEVPPKPTNKRKPKANAAKVGKSAKDSD